jgi:hypothetical protein
MLWSYALKVNFYLQAVGKATGCLRIDSTEGLRKFLHLSRDFQAGLNAPQKKNISCGGSSLLSA